LLSFDAESFDLHFAKQNTKTKIQNNHFAVLFVCKILSLTPRADPWLRVFENRVQRIYLVRRGTRKQGNAENCITRRLLICTPDEILFG
jgi:hypothetical protein